MGTYKASQNSNGGKTQPSFMQIYSSMHIQPYQFVYFVYLSYHAKFLNSSFKIECYGYFSEWQRICVYGYPLKKKSPLCSCDFAKLRAASFAPAKNDPGLIITQYNFYCTKAFTISTLKSFRTCLHLRRLYFCDFP